MAPILTSLGWTKGYQLAEEILVIVVFLIPHLRL
jgi:hypothetical protein